MTNDKVAEVAFNGAIEQASSLRDGARNLAALLALRDYAPMWLEAAAMNLEGSGPPRGLRMHKDSELNRWYAIVADLGGARFHHYPLKNPPASVPSLHLIDLDLDGPEIDAIRAFESLVQALKDRNPEVAAVLARAVARLRKAN